MLLRVASLLIVLTCSGCGVKGDLYLMEKQLTSHYMKVVESSEGKTDKSAGDS
ncbi:MAG: lipoprotein [Pseudomonadota bacterium]